MFKDFFLDVCKEGNFTSLYVCGRKIDGFKPRGKADIDAWLSDKQNKVLMSAMAWRRVRGMLMAAVAWPLAFAGLCLAFRADFSFAIAAAIALNVSVMSLDVLLCDAHLLLTLRKIDNVPLTEPLDIVAGIKSGRIKNKRLAPVLLRLHALNALTAALSFAALLYRVVKRV